jgi:ABC-type transporter Mla subunit MlaD
VRRILLSAALLVGATALLAGCGGGGGGSSSSSAADWASGYCSGATSWVTALDDARASVKTGTTPEEAAQTVTGQTNTFMESISGLGTPDTPDGSTSAATAKDLTEKLSGRVARISGAIDTNNPDVTAAQRTKIVQDQIAASLTDVSSTTAKLAQDDAELGTAMAASSDCASLKTALAKASA